MIKNIQLPGHIAILTFIFFLSCQPENKIDLALNPLFSDHMVLQQQQQIDFAGVYTPDENVSISASWGEKSSTVSDIEGNWKLQLNTPEAGGPFEVSIVTKDSTIELNDVMVGEVWLASGQSNMQMPLKGWPPNDPILNSEEEIANADYPDIRMFTVSRNLSITPIDTFKGQWISASPETAGDFSATAYFFARRLYMELQIPIGIIHSSWGGTVAEAWTSQKSLEELGDFDEQINILQNTDNQELIKNWFDSRVTINIPETDGGWQNISFIETNVSGIEFDENNWNTIELPGRIDQMSSGQIDGAIWLRKEFAIDDISSDYVLNIGAIDDMDATYINGQKIGGLAGAGFYNTPREMVIPKSLLVSGTNIIAIRVIDTGGPGSVMGPMTITNDVIEISLEGTWKVRPVAEIYQGKFYIYDLETDLLTRPNVFQLNPNIPTVLFNAMINPLVSYHIRGAIWYQGESNVGRDEQYKRLFPAMIEDWREQWGYQFPFYFVQIAPFIYNPDPEMQLSQKLRDAQRFALKTAKTGMAVTLDIGNPRNIHPANKQDVGARLARLALVNDYGADMVASGPLFKRQEVSGKRLILEFDYIGTGLMSSSDLSGFEIAGTDGNFVPAKALIVDDKIEVSAPNVPAPAFARYAWKDDSKATLFNKEGLPASSFTTEN